MWLDWVHWVHQSHLPKLRSVNLTISAVALLSCKGPRSQVPGIRTRTSLGHGEWYYSTYDTILTVCVPWSRTLNEYLLPTNVKFIFSVWFRRSFRLNSNLFPNRRLTLLSGWFPLRVFNMLWFSWLFFQLKCPIVPPLLAKVLSTCQVQLKLPHWHDRSLNCLI